MYDIEELEAKWMRYRRKRLLLPAVFTAVLFLIIGIGFYYYLEQQDVRASSQSPLPIPEKNSQSNLQTSLLPEVPSTVKSSKASGWHISFDDQSSGSNTSMPKNDYRHFDIQVTSQKSQNGVRNIEKRFHETKNKEDALFLARYYYDKKSYKDALKWALETNKLDTSMDESWLIFAKAKMKTGSRIEAIRLLQAYVDRSKSPKAEKLLRAIRRGESF